MPRRQKPKPRHRPAKRGKKVAWELDDGDWKRIEAVFPVKLVGPERVVSDKGYDDDPLRERFAKRGIDLIAPYRNNRVNRPYEDRKKRRRYRHRWKVERTNAWFKNFRRVTVRWDRNLTVYKGFVHLACICITLINLFHNPQSISLFCHNMPFLEK